MMRLEIWHSLPDNGPDRGKTSMTKRNSLLATTLLAACLATSLAGTSFAKSPAPKSSSPSYDLIQPVAPQSVGMSAEGLKALDAAMAKAVADGDVAGLSTLLVRHGKVVQFKTYGQASIDQAKPMAKDTILRIYSMTKPITGVAMMMLYEEGKWKLDDPVSKYLPELGNLTVMSGVDGQGNVLTVPAKRVPTMRELMSHTSGFGYGLDQRSPIDKMFRKAAVLQSNDLADLVTRTSKIPLKFQPGENWSYSIGVDLQGRIVEVLSGQKFSDFLQQRIFTPLNMKDTAFYVEASKVDRLSDVYATNPATGKLIALSPKMGPQVQDFTKLHGLESGGGGLTSTASDYGRFSQMVLNGGTLDGVRLLKPQTLALMGVDAIAPGIHPDGSLIAGMGTSAFAFKDGVGFGLDFMVVSDPKAAALPVGKGTLSWGGAAGTWFWIDPTNDLYFVGMIQRMGAKPGGADLPGQAQALTYKALTHPEK